MAMAKQAHERSATLRAATEGLPTPKHHDMATGKAVVTEKAEKPLTDRAAADKSQPARAISAFDVLAYQRDVLERSILLFDTLRRRANAMLGHERLGLPALLNFKSEMLLDARQFERPFNYALLRITEVGDKCWDDCVDPSTPPVVVIDPRAGHGPGIGGFKPDSEVGICASHRSPVYFVVFFAEPHPDMPAHDHVHHDRGGQPEGSFWTSRAFLACVVFLIIGGILLWTEHLAHALGYLPYLLILACPLMHIFMHGSHGGHGTHAHHSRTDRNRRQADGGKP